MRVPVRVPMKAVNIASVAAYEALMVLGLLDLMWTTGRVPVIPQVVIAGFGLAGVYRIDQTRRSLTRPSRQRVRADDELSRLEGVSDA